MAHHVLVLNATYEPLNVTSIWRACSLVLADKAEVLEAHPERVIRSPSATLPHPVVIRLRSFVRVPRFQTRRLTRRALFARDGYRCQYCGRTSHLTVDHVVPRSRGGTSVWENIVTACGPCNLRKADRLPAEVDMHPSEDPACAARRAVLHALDADHSGVMEMYLSYLR